MSNHYVNLDHDKSWNYKAHVNGGTLGEHDYKSKTAIHKYPEYCKTLLVKGMFIVSLCDNYFYNSQYKLL